MTAVSLHACKKTETVYATFNADRNEIVVLAQAGKEYIQVASTAAWSLSGLPNWITAQPANGSGPAKIELTYVANTALDARMAELTLKSSETVFTPIKIKFVQAGTDVSITSFTEHAKGGDDVVINGFGFSDKKEDNTVTINGKPATVSEASLTKITVKVPMAAGDGPIVVKVGDKIKSSLNNFVYDWVWSVSTIAGTGSITVLENPSGVAVSADGSLYVADKNNHRVRRIVEKAAGVYEISTFAGSDLRVTGNVDGESSAARFAFPSEMAIDDRGILFVPDANSYIRKITNDGRVSKVTNPDGTPLNILTEGITSYGGNLFVSDLNNNSIRMIAPAGTISTIADNADTYPAFNTPKGIVTSKDGKKIFVCDSKNNRIQQINFQDGGTRERIVKAGALNGQSGNADGSGTNASFNNPNDIAVDAHGVLYVADQDNHLIRKMVTRQDGTTEVTTIAGTGNAGYQDAVGAQAAFRQPASIAVNSNGTTIYVADKGNNRIRKLTLQ